MNQNNERGGYGQPERRPPKKPRYSGSMTSYTKRRRHDRVNLGLLVFALIMAVAIGTSIFFIIRNNTDDIVYTSADASTVTTTTLESAPPKEPKEYVTVSETDVHRGCLILVNSTHKYVFPDESNVIDVYPEKNGCYSLSTGDLQLDRDIISVFNKLTSDFSSQSGFNSLLLNHAYRSYDSQVDTYNYYLELIGEEATAKRVAVPGYSEHHTGYAFDLAVYKDGSGSNITENPECAELIKMLPEYGFILRYPDDKVEVTGIGFEPWHYRYVGAPHSLIITAMGVCLEEYTEMIKGYTADSSVLVYDGRKTSSCSLNSIPDDSYAIYFVPVSGSTEVPLPSGREYTISGNNDGGVVVTVLPKQSDNS